MKKAICVLLALLMVTGTFAGCSKDNAADTTAATTAVETTEEETTPSVPVLTDEQILALSASDFEWYWSSMNIEGLSKQEAVQKRTNMTARQFLNYIKNKKVDDIAYFINGTYSKQMPDWKTVTNEAYLFFNSVEVDSYEISEGRQLDPEYINLPEYKTDFEVILHISKSGSALFPVGTSRWILSIPNSPFNTFGTTIVHLFRNANDSSTLLFSDRTSSATDFCYTVSVHLGCFETMTDFNNLATNAKAKGSFHHFGYSFVTLLLLNRDGYYKKSALPAKRTEIEAMAKSAFGITNIDFKEVKTYNSTNDTLDSSGGYYSLDIPATMASSTYDQATRIHTIVIDYYSDFACLLKARTMKYTLREQADGSFTLLSTRLVYDSGYNMYSYSLGV